MPRSDVPGPAGKLAFRVRTAAAAGHARTWQAGSANNTDGAGSTDGHGRQGGTQRPDQSLVSLLYGALILACWGPKSTSTAMSCSTPMTTPRPYLSCVTWSCTAYCSSGGAAGGALNGLPGK